MVWGEEEKWHFFFLPIHRIEIKEFLMELPFLNPGGLVNFNTITRFNSQTPCISICWTEAQGFSIPYSRVAVSKAQVANVKTFCQDHFKANVFFLNGVNPTVWTLRYAIPHHTKQLFEELGYGLQLD